MSSSPRWHRGIYDQLGRDDMPHPLLPSWGVAAPQMTAAEAAEYYAAHPLPEPTPADRQRAHDRDAAAAADRSHRTAIKQAERIVEYRHALTANPNDWAAQQNLEDAEANHRFAVAQVAQVVHYGRRERVHHARPARPRARRPRAQATRSSAKSGDGPGDGPEDGGDRPKPRPAPRLAPPSRAVLVRGARPAADMEATR